MYFEKCHCINFYTLLVLSFNSFINSYLHIPCPPTSLWWWLGMGSPQSSQQLGQYLHRHRAGWWWTGGRLVSESPLSDRLFHVLKIITISNVHILWHSKVIYNIYLPFHALLIYLHSADCFLLAVPSPLSLPFAARITYHANTIFKTNFSVWTIRIVFAQSTSLIL